ncbi:MAG: hypothetical protein ACLQQ4_05435 [Bacteroidia bacterium]
MNISQYNYEAYFLDYHEGRLDAQATKELMDFLALHPELMHEFESFEPVSLNDIDEGIKFENKASLKKSVTPVNASNFDEIAVQYIDGTLNPTLTAELLAFVKDNSKYEKELAAYRLTKLAPDTAIVFENKELLKRRTRRPAAYYYWSAAASIALLVAAYFIINPGKEHNQHTLASSNTKVDTSLVNIKNTQPVNNVINPPAIARESQNITATAKEKVGHISRRHAHSSITETPVANITKHDSANVAIQQKPFIPKRDTAASPASNNFVSVHPADTGKQNTIAQQQSPVQNITANPTPAKKENKSVFAFASGAFKSIGRLFRHGGFEFNKYYSKDSDKVIAYQITLGDNRYTIPLRNSSY